MKGARGLVALLVVTCLTAPVGAQGTLVWADEFDGTSLNTADWSYMLGDGTSYGLPAGWGNNELQYYTNRTQNVFVSGGALHVVARQENYAGYSYTSARLRTLNKRDFLYGRIEGRMQVPSTTGIWPAFWMLPSTSVYGGWAASGEIDIMESVNVAMVIYGTIHYGGAWPNNVSSGGTVFNGQDFGNGFHIYALEWEPDTMRWYVDGVLYYTVSSATWYSTAAPGNDRAPFDQPFHLLLNVAVGGNFPGPPDGSSVFPQELIVDWVRVYELSSTQTPFGGQPAIVPGVIEAEDFDDGGEGVAYHDCDATNSGGAYRPTTGVDIEASSEGAYNVGWMCAGEWLEYTVDVQAGGSYLIETRVASDSTGGSFHLEFDGVDSTGTIVVPITGGWQNWVTVTALADLTAGPQVMRFVNADTTDEYNVNSFTFLPLSPADLDRDGDVDLDDHALFATCLAGPLVDAPPGGCSADLFSAGDLNHDGRVDLADFAPLQALFGM